MQQTHKTGAVISFCIVMLGVVIATFWQQDWRYSLPTPRPKLLVQPAVGTTMRYPLMLAGVRVDLPAPSHSLPVFLHFFNPDCPCSRFNLTHMRDLLVQYGMQVRFIAVVQGKPTLKFAQKIKSCHLPMEVVYDQNGSVAKSCGVYSTPQAVLLNSQGQLYYRGNYNASRYCEDPATDFARISLDALLSGHPTPHFPKTATVAYGCALPISHSKTF